MNKEIYASAETVLVELFVFVLVVFAVVLLEFVSLLSGSFLIHTFLVMLMVLLPDSFDTQVNS